jgi:hypothetical protein
MQQEIQEAWEKILSEISEQNASQKVVMIKNFLIGNNSKESPISPNDVIEIINQAEIQFDWSKAGIIQDFISSPKSPKTTSDEVIKMINQTGIENDGSKKGIIIEFLRSPKSFAMTPQDLAKIIKGVGLQNQADYSIQLYQSKFSTSENYIENFIDFTKSLQP